MLLTWKSGHIRENREVAGEAASSVLRSSQIHADLAGEERMTNSDAVRRENAGLCEHISTLYVAILQINASLDLDTVRGAAVALVSGTSRSRCK